MTSRICCATRGIVDLTSPQWSDEMTKDKLLREHVLKLLEGRGAHADFETVMKKIPVAARGTRPKSAAHSPWEIVEHMRIAQADILQFSRDPKHVSPKWPEGYWPETPAPPNRNAWNQSVHAFLADHASMSALVGDESTDLFAPIPHGD